jgi:hypothetical protein
LLALLALSLGGCDVIVAGVLASRSSKDSSSSDGPPPPPDTTSKIWVANLSALSAGDLDIERDLIAANGGAPSTSTWTAIAGGQSATFVLDVSGVAGPFDTVLIQCPKIEPHAIDAFEVLGANDVVLETGAAAGVRSNHFDFGLPGVDVVAGAPDGRVGTSSVPSAVDESAFLFCRFSAAFTRVRISLWAVLTGRASGDVEWVNHIAEPSDQITGGAGVKADGTYYVTYSQGTPRAVNLYTLSSAGAIVDLDSLELNVSTNLGSQSVAISGDNVYIATTFGAGDVRIQKVAGLGSFSASPVSGAGVDRVERNGLAVDGAGNVLLAAGFDFGGAGTVGHFMKKYNAAGGEIWAGSPTPPTDTNETYWHAVVAPGTTNIYSAGDFTSGSVQAYIRRSDSTASGAEVLSILSGGPDAETDLAHAIGVDGAGNVYVAGYHGASGPSRDAFLLKYAADLGGSPTPLVAGTAAGNDEILDIAVETDGTVYAVGYETVASPAQGENLFLVKFDPAGLPVWRRTLHHGFGNDRGVSVSTTAAHVYVAGQVTVSGGTTDVHVRKYVK